MRRVIRGEEVEGCREKMLHDTGALVGCWLLAVGWGAKAKVGRGMWIEAIRSPAIRWGTFDSGKECRCVMRGDGVACEFVVQSAVSTSAKMGGGELLRQRPIDPASQNCRRDQLYF